MNFSFNSVSPLAKFLIGMALVLVAAFFQVSSGVISSFFQGALMGGGIIMELFAVIAFFKKRKLEKQSSN